MSDSATMPAAALRRTDLPKLSHFVHLSAN